MVKVPYIVAVLASAAIVSGEYLEPTELLGNNLEHQYEENTSGYDQGGYWGGELDTHGATKEEEERKDYNYDYTVHDPKEDKYHQHQESRKDGVVQGYYSVKEADGSLREVHYTADKEHGFKAIVVKNGEQVHPHTGASNHQDPGWD